MQAALCAPEIELDLAGGDDIEVVAGFALGVDGLPAREVHEMKLLGYLGYFGGINSGEEPCAGDDPVCGVVRRAFDGVHNSHEWLIS